jgi:cation:H+ antiporter
LLQIFLLILGFILVVKGADFLIKGACSLADRMKVSELAVGLTVVAFGTSLPELSVNILASVQGNSGIAIGNVLGSNIANILLILGISAVIYPLTVTRGTVLKEIPFCLLAVVVFGFLANDRIINADGRSVLTRSDGLVMLSFFIIFIYYTIGIAKDVRKDIGDYVHKEKYGTVKTIVLISLGIVSLSLGGKWIVDGAVFVAAGLGVSQTLIGLTIVAVGTSVPELATSVVAALKKNPDIAVGNIVGSNIFNIFFILGISSIIRPLPMQARDNIDIIVVIIATLLLFLSMFTGKKRTLDRWEGCVFIFFYAAYIALVIILR